MKIKILILSILSFVAISSFVSAGEISLEPSHGKYSPGCMLGIDIVIDPEGKQISATDIVVESSMKFVKFEPTQVFPYFFPPKIIENIVHIVGFTSGPSQRVSKKGVIGKIFFKPQNKSDLDGSIKFYFKKKGNTTDTNLSIKGGIDVLEDIRNGFYTFDGISCDYPQETTIQEASNINFDNALRQTIKKVEKDFDKTNREHKAAELQKSREDNKTYIISIFIVVFVLATYFKISKGRSKKK
ncbi:MAG: hypothetical protein WAZ12_03335 [Candidatus Absconditicoccaceae bacterium]